MAGYRRMEVDFPSAYRSAMEVRSLEVAPMELAPLDCNGSLLGKELHRNVLTEYW